MRRALKSLDTEVTTLKKKEKRIRIAVDEEVEIELKRIDMQRKLKKSKKSKKSKKRRRSSSSSSSSSTEDEVRLNRYQPLVQPSPRLPSSAALSTPRLLSSVAPSTPTQGQTTPSRGPWTPSRPSSSLSHTPAIRRLLPAVREDPIGTRVREETPESEQSVLGTDFQVSGTVVDLHLGVQPMDLVLFNVKRVFNIPVSI